jgi:thymidylate kinase
MTSRTQKGSRGLIVVLVGPDGTGKSSLARLLPEACGDLFQSHLHLHWRPGLLPWPGEVLKSDPGDPSEPHARAPHGRVLSTGLLLYNWLDFFAGGWFRLVPARRRGSLVILERGWWDISVDSRRYRLRSSPGTVAALGRLLPRPDLVLILHADTATLLARKREVAAEELQRQLDRWRDVLPGSIHRAHIDASQPQRDVLTAARAQIRAAIGAGDEVGSGGEEGSGWSGLPSRHSPRWLLPRGPARVARGALNIYQPVTVKGRFGWEFARLLAGAGVFRLLPKADPPPDEIRRVMASFLPTNGSIATVRSRWDKGKFVALGVDDSGSPVVIAKLGLDDVARKAINREATAIEGLGGLMPSLLSPPEIVAKDDGLLVLAPVKSRPRLAPWRLPEEVAWALGDFFRAGASDDGRRGPAQGDCAPWNLLKSDGGWVLVDWELARQETTAFFDICHWLTLVHSMLGRPSATAIEEGFQGRGWIAAVLHAYADAASVDVTEARAMLASYLMTEQARWLDLDPATAAGRRRLLAVAKARG